MPLLWYSGLFIVLASKQLQTRSASQNDRLNLSFVKDIYGNVKKMARKGGKMVIYESQILGLTLYQKFTNTIAIYQTRKTKKENL